MKDEDLIKAGWFSNFPKLAINDLITEMIRMKMAYSIGDEDDFYYHFTNLRRIAVANVLYGCSAKDYYVDLWNEGIGIDYFVKNELSVKRINDTSWWYMHFSKLALDDVITEMVKMKIAYWKHDFDCDEMDIHFNKLQNAVLIIVRDSVDL